MSVSTWEQYRAEIADGRLLRVVNFHNTPVSLAGNLRDHLRALARDFETIGYDQFEALVHTGTWHGPKPPVVLVFYEGYANHASVAAPLLDELGLTGWFFIPTAFPAVPPEEQMAFAEAHNLGIVAEERNAARLALTWEEVAELACRHVIAAHTASHEELDAIVSTDDIEREIVEPYRTILRVTGRPPAATAFLYGAPVDHHPAVEAALKETGYRFVFSNTKLQRLAPPGE
jgi:peptidoglycan/xylan/chitin deacetylase (PgdA/CDA1 family)